MLDVSAFTTLQSNAESSSFSLGKLWASNSLEIFSRNKLSLQECFIEFLKSVPSLLVLSNIKGYVFIIKMKSSILKATDECRQ